MKFNVSKFLIKSILFTAFAASLTSGYVNGMDMNAQSDENQSKYECIICLQRVTDGEAVTLHETEKEEGKRHKFCKECLKNWLQNAKGNKINKCPVCTLMITCKELVDLFKLDTKMIKTKIKEWNSYIKEEYKLDEDDLPFMYTLKNVHKIEWFLDLDYKYEYEEDKMRALYSGIRGYSYAYENETQFINSGLGFCGHCCAIMKRPEMIWSKEGKRLHKYSGKNSRYSKNCPVCGKENFNVQWSEDYKEDHKWSLEKGQLHVIENE